MNRTLALIFLTLGLFAWVWADDEDSEFKAKKITRDESAQVQLTYLGTAGWEITDGKIVILLDPYLSRLRVARPGPPTRTRGEDKHPIISPQEGLVSDKAAIDAHISRADYILISHAHSDHVLDAPYIAKKTGATVIGNLSAINYARASGVEKDKLITARGGEDYEFGQFALKIIPSLHSPLNDKHYFNDGIIPANAKLPLKHGEFAEGGTLAYYIRIGSHRILAFGSMNYIEREIDGLRPDVVIVGAAPSRGEIYDYTGRLLRATGFPSLVLPNHWDNFSSPFDAPQESAIQRVESFVQEVNAASPKSRVIIPKYFDPIILPPFAPKEDK